ncbi:MAG: winged helix-turn-helix transcriptional regulator [Methanosarcinaceae archaeon]|nr:winged helix-turn-helix transcriptional regulator [Methanosarcinaceae archaeon]
MDEKLIAGISLVKSSRHRRKILNTINNDTVTPSEISKDTTIRLNHVSMYLSELKEGGLVECLNESAKKGRLYQLTELGKKVIQTTG